MTKTSGDPARPLRAVFVLDLERAIEPLIAAWLAAGHTIAAVVAPARKPRGNDRLGRFLRRAIGRPRLRERLEALGVPILQASPPYDWSLHRRVLSDSRADLLICFAFPRRIPDETLALFPLGGVNFHPALLPRYRGPFPIHRLVLDDRWREHGGVTLHRMSAGFDEGDILAQIRFAMQDWRSLAAFNAALGSAMAWLATEALPKLATGEIGGMKQGRGDTEWASLDTRPVIVGQDWTTSHLRHVCTFCARWPGVAIPVGDRLVLLAEQAGRVRAPRRAPPALSRGKVSFDLSDGRVTYRLRSKATLRLRKLRARLPVKPRRARPPDIVYPESLMPEP